MKYKKELKAQKQKEQDVAARDQAAKNAAFNKLQAEKNKRQQTIHQKTGIVNLFAGDDAAW